MIDISFLRKERPMLIDGMEFLDWQNDSTLFQQLSELFNGSIEDNVLKLNKDKREEIEEIIKRTLNMTITIKNVDTGNLSVDAGYIKPGNLLDIPGIHKWYDKKYSKIGEAFKDLKTKVIKGHVNTTNGRLEGDFSKINFNIYINNNLKDYLNLKEIEKLGCSVGEAIAALVVHECGHIYSGMLFLERTTLDNMLAIQGTAIALGESTPKAKEIVIKETLKVLEANEKLPENIETLTSDELIIYFEKATINRDYRRSFSLGVESMTAEVLADAFAVRFGCAKGLVAGLRSIYSVYEQSVFSSVIKLLALEIIFAVAIPATALVIVASAMSGAIGLAVGATSFIYMLVVIVGIMRALTLLKVFNYVVNATVSGTYDTPYRRIKTVLRDVINQIESMKDPALKDTKKNLLEQAKRIELIAENQKSMLEGTITQRFYGFMFDGNDFSRSNLEHYTAELTSTTLALNTTIRN